MCLKDQGKEASGIRSADDGATPRPVRGEAFEKIIGTMEVATVYLGDRLGLYRALGDGEPATPLELAERTGIHERYAREWLEQQAVMGILEIVDGEEEGSARGYTLG
jgi:hypothetical protein